MITSDGYILQLNRIPHERNSPCLNEYTNSEECRKPVVFIQHGLFSSSADFLISGPQHALAFYLADAGYDVWLGNFRGNTYSRRHENMSPNDKEFWNFCWHELGMVDLPEMIDYVLRRTNMQKLHYIGHSQGSTTFLVMTSSRPQYNDKIETAHLMAPMAFMSHMRSPLIQAIAPVSNTMSRLNQLVGSGEFNPTGDFLSHAGQFMCRNQVMAKEVCSNAFFLLTGFDTDQLNATVVSEIMRRYPAGSSVRQIAHYGQAVNSGKFSQFDHGSIKNMAKYGTATPPSYQLNQIRASISLYYGNDDWLASVDDVTKLKGKLQTVRNDYQVSRSKWNHIDFLWATDARTTVYSKILQNMRRRD